jgi:hypothetical protein
MDLPFHWLGRSHRKLFHNYSDAALLGAIVTKGDPKGAIAGILHVLTDEVATGNPDVKRILEGMARLDSILNRRYKARTRRRKSHRRPPSYPWK